MGSSPPISKHINLKLICKALIEFAFPPLCLHCQEQTKDFRRLLCALCNEQLVLLSPQGRCNRCFSEMDEEMHCKRCQQLPLCLDRVAAAFDYMGSPATLVQHLKYDRRTALARSLAAYLVIQLDILKWPLPDLIVPIPQALMHFLSRGFNQSLLIAKELGQLLEIPVEDLLRRKSGSFSQTELSAAERSKVTREAFDWKRKSAIAGKRILIIDDVTTTRSTLNGAASFLREAFPSSLYGLAVCAS